MNLSEKVGQKIISLIESGNNPFNIVYNTNVKKELTTEDAKIRSINYKTNKLYEGINRFILGVGYFLTFNQIKEMKGTLKKDSKGKPVFFHTYQTTKKLTEFDEKKIAEAEANGLNKFTTYNNYYEKVNDEWQKSYYCDKSFTVFNIEDCEGLPILHEPKNIVEQEENLNLKEILENYSTKSGFKFIEGKSNNINFNDKVITILSKAHYANEGDYYQTLFRTIATSTRQILNRKVNENFSDETYCQENLTSEIASVLICGSAKVLDEQSQANSSAYLRKWSDTIQGAKLINRIWTSVNDAIKIFDYLTN